MPLKNESDINDIEDIDTDISLPDDIEIYQISDAEDEIVSFDDFEIEEDSVDIEDIEIDDEIYPEEELDSLNEIEFEESNESKESGIVESVQTYENIYNESNISDSDDFFKSEAFTNPEEIKWEADFDLLSKNIESLTHGIDLPSAIFSLAVNSFDLTSGIFLTFESESRIFSPFSSLAIDETSLRRCQIPIENLEENDLIFNGNSIDTRVSKDFLKNHLSKRLWDTIETLDMCIFSHHDKTFGLLLMFNCQACNDPQFIDFVSLFTRKCSELFSNSRSSKISSLPSFPQNPPVDIEEALDIVDKRFSVLNNESVDPIKLIIINYADIIENVINKNDSIDRFRLENDIFKMYNSMLFGSSFIIRITKSRLLIIFTSGLNSNNMVIQNQMSASLLSLFEKNSVIDQPIIIVEEFSAASEGIVEIKSFLSTNL